jgi:DNA-binding CsgD family transcriptional regulator
MAASTFGNRPERRELELLKAESERLRLELMRSGLDINYTIARISEAMPGSRTLEERCRSLARLGCSRLERMLPQAGPAREEFAQKLGQLRAALDSEAPLAQPKTAAPAPTRNGSSNKRGTDREQSSAVEILTRRETEVLRYIAQGHSTKQVAVLLGITFKTAACHRYRVMDKLGIHETANLVRYAIRQGMVEA